MRRVASLLLVLLALSAMGCVRELRHYPDGAALAAEEFVRTLVIQNDALTAFDLTDPASREGRTAADLKKLTEQSPGYGEVTEVSATHYQPVLGQPAMDIFLTGRAGKIDYYYVVRVSGTVEAGYRPAKLAVSEQPMPESDMRRPLQ